jgi:hypothetical protein
VRRPRPSRATLRKLYTHTIAARTQPSEGPSTLGSYVRQRFLGFFLFLPWADARTYSHLPTHTPHAAMRRPFCVYNPKKKWTLVATAIPIAAILKLPERPEVPAVRDGVDDVGAVGVLSGGTGGGRGGGAQAACGS